MIQFILSLFRKLHIDQMGKKDANDGESEIIIMSTKQSYLDQLAIKQEDTSYFGNQVEPKQPKQRKQVNQLSIGAKNQEKQRKQIDEVPKQINAQIESAKGIDSMDTSEIVIKSAELLKESVVKNKTNIEPGNDQQISNSNVSQTADVISNTAEADTPNPTPKSMLSATQKLNLQLAMQKMVNQFIKKVSPRKQIKQHQKMDPGKNISCDLLKLEGKKKSMRQMTPMERMWKLAEWNKGMKRTTVLSEDRKKVKITFDNDKTIAKDNLIPSFDQNSLVRKLKSRRTNKGWTEWKCDLCQIFKGHIHQKPTNKNKDHHLLIVKQYPYVKDNNGKLQMSPFCEAELNFNRKMVELDKKNPLQNRQEEKLNIAINDDKQQCTYIYQMNLKKRIISQMYDERNPFCCGQFHICLSDALFISKVMEKKDRKFVYVKHGPFYESILIHQKLFRCDDMLKQLIRIMAKNLKRFVDNGLVHGNIISDNIEYKVVQSLKHPDHITDFRIVNYEFSYEYGKNKHSYFELDKKFASKSMPPEMVNNLKLFYTNKKHKMRDLQQIEAPWSHDVWSMGILIVEIVAGCQIDKADDSIIQSRFEKNQITKGLLALPRLVLDYREPCQTTENVIEHNCPIVMKKFYVALDAVQMNFLDTFKRTIKLKDIYKLFNNLDLFDLVLQMLHEDPRKRISPDQMLAHPYLNNK